ncbi:hypothetical protein, partial [Escherichia coli]|uniref:hypothetical protein n=1 Tax=Escherichia coli TaxID=562 RepID=UPI003EE20E97
MFALADINSFYASCEKVFRPDLRNEPVIDLSDNDVPVLWFFGPVHYQQITILHASLVHRFTAGAQKEGG